jgi:hypothetical protein
LPVTRTRHASAATSPRTASEDSEPAPENVFIGEDPDVPDHPPERLLERFSRGIFVTAGNDQKIARQTIEVGIEEDPEGDFIADD